MSILGGFPAKEGAAIPICAAIAVGNLTIPGSLANLLVAGAPMLLPAILVGMRRL